MYSLSISPSAQKLTYEILYVVLLLCFVQHSPSRWYFWSCNSIYIYIYMLISTQLLSFALLLFFPILYFLMIISCKYISLYMQLAYCDSDQWEMSELDVIYMLKKIVIHILGVTNFIYNSWLLSFISHKSHTILPSVNKHAVSTISNAYCAFMHANFVGHIYIYLKKLLLQPYIFQTIYMYTQHRWKTSLYIMVAAFVVSDIYIYKFCPNMSDSTSFVK